MHSPRAIGGRRVRATARPFAQQPPTLRPPFGQRSKRIVYETVFVDEVPSENAWVRGGPPLSVKLWPNRWPAFATFTASSPIGPVANSPPRPPPCTGA